MAYTYADYVYYIGEYGGKKVSTVDFNRLSLLASMYIDNETKNRIVETTDTIKMCMCALVDELQDQTEPEVASETSGKESRSYVKSEKTDNQKLYEIIERWLASTGLLYRGLT